jgi:transketolase
MTDITTRCADNIRILSAAMVEAANSGHPGGAMGGADFTNILYTEYLNFDPDNPQWAHRDRFFLDPGHMSAMLYSQLHLCGLFTMDELRNFRRWGSPTPGHPEKDFARGIENTSGPLGQGHTNAVGAAIAERFLVARFGEWMAHKTYAFISDGGIQEEIAQGAGRIAGHLGLNNLIMFYDANDIQLSTEVDEVMTEDTAKKYEAWGWNVVIIDGNNPNAIRGALDQAQSSDKPFLIIGKTIMGKGAVTADGENFERKVSTHGQPLSDAGASMAATIANLGGDPENPFSLLEGVGEYYEQTLSKKRAAVAQRHAAEAKWAAANPARAAKLADFFSGKVPEIDFSSIEQKANGSTRDASRKVLGVFAEQIENMVVSSADLSNSDRTDGFLNKSKAFAKGDFSGGFLQAGVSELTMAAICNGLALHGGVIPVCGTFFVFSDYMKPAIRLAALMELPVKYVWTHDAFRVGEDGPTHQPVEHEAQIRLMEKLKTHTGKSSLLALRPGDVDEATVCWKMALENTTGPTGLIFSRQGITSLPASDGQSRYQSALEAAKGAYIVSDDGGTPDIIFVASGSEVATLEAGANILRAEKGMKIRVVSAPSEGLFRQQSEDYQASVIPFEIPCFGLTAGLPVTLEGLVGPAGKVYGLDHFGYSANYKVLDEKFGFTPENICKEVLDYLGK